MSNKILPHMTELLLLNSTIAINFSAAIILKYKIIQLLYNQWVLLENMESYKNIFINPNKYLGNESDEKVFCINFFHIFLL
jgi:hypothetical protein